MAESVSKRIVFTGGSGKAGRHAIPYLLQKGHSVLNLDLTPFPENHLPPGKSVYTLKTDLTDSGQAFNAISSLFNMSEFALPEHPGVPDAVIHFAASARNMLVPDNETFRINTLSTYNVVEAASKLGVKKIIVASSETVYGVCFSQGRDTDLSYHSYPLDEDTYQVDPMDTYGCSKICCEQIARTFARRFNKKTDIYVLRIGNVIEPHEYATDFPNYVNQPHTRKRNAWSYVDARDLGQMCHLCVMAAPTAVEENKSLQGFHIFNATNDAITTKVPTSRFLAENEPDTEITRDMDEWEAPLTNRKIREVLGFRQEHDWRMYYQP